MDGFVNSVQTMGSSDFFWMAVVLGALTVVGFVLWRRALQNARVMEDVPTSKVRSAAQGYLELVGRQHPIDERPLSAPLSGRSCTWWFYEIERKERRTDSKGRTRTTWVTVEKRTSPQLIRFEDGTGEVVVNPAGAEVVPVISNQWYGHSKRPTGGPPAGSSFLSITAAFGRYRYTEKIMCPGEPMYAIGHFETRSGELGPSERARRKAELLAEWKEDQEGLVERFDADGDGAVDLQEWERAREEAERVVEQKVAESALDPDVDLLLKPPDGRPFILSPKSQEELTRHYRVRSLLGLAIFLLCGAVLGVAMTARFGG
jgi:hypothetical protein